MKKTMLLVGLLATSPALAEMPVNFFVGGNLGLSSISYTDYYDDKYAPDTFFKIGLEGGLKFGNTKNIYNIGITGFYDYVFPSKFDPVFTLYLGADSASVNYSVFGASLDNYIRIDNTSGTSTFLVLGLGYSFENQTINVKSGGFSVDVNDDTKALFLKAGGIYNANAHFGLTFDVKAFIFEDAVITHYEIGARYTF